MIAWPPPHVPQLPGRTAADPDIGLRDTAGGVIAALPAQATTASLYVCGITPYDATHLGHAATYIAFDLVVRAWRDTGRTVRFVQNVTDVDDPLLERARDTGQDWQQLAAREIALFREDMTALSVIPPDVYMGVVEAVPLVVQAITSLLARGVAYRVPGQDGGPDGDLYFDVSADPDFGRVSSLDRAAMRSLFAERGGDPDRPGKRDPLDPLLWRVGRPGEPAWDGAGLGRGRPGWHIECSCIAREYLGLPFDVQGGGNDLSFPHHEMSASHGRLLTGGREFAGSYVHAGMVGWQGAKMSKSKGNLVLVSTLRDQGRDPMAIRLALLAHHYSGDWEWTEDGLLRAEARLARWRHAVSREGGPDAAAMLATVRAALADDLDAPAALLAVDAWCESQFTSGGGDLGAPGIVARTVDALLGIRL